MIDSSKHKNSYPNQSIYFSSTHGAWSAGHKDNMPFEETSTDSNFEKQVKVNFCEHKPSYPKPSLYFAVLGLFKKTLTTTRIRSWTRRFGVPNLQRRRHLTLPSSLWRHTSKISSWTRRCHALGLFSEMQRFGATTFDVTKLPLACIFSRPRWRHDPGLPQHKDLGNRLFNNICGYWALSSDTSSQEQNIRVFHASGRWRHASGLFSACDFNLTSLSSLRNEQPPPAICTITFSHKKILRCWTRVSMSHMLEPRIFTVEADILF